MRGLPAAISLANTPPSPVEAGVVARRRVTMALMLASGFAGLGYQIVWTQQSPLWLGHDAAAVLAVRHVVVEVLGPRLGGALAAEAVLAIAASGCRQW